MKKVLLRKVSKESACNPGDSGLLPGSGRSPGEGIDYPLQCSWASLVAFLVAQLVKNLPARRKTWVRSLGWKISWRRERLPTAVFCPREFHGLYSPRDGKESDMTFTFAFIVTLCKKWNMCHPGWEEDIGENGYMYMYGWAPSPETITTLLIGYIPIQNKKFKKIYFC